MLDQFKSYGAKTSKILIESPKSKFPQKNPLPMQDSHIMLIHYTLLVGQYEVRMVTYFSVVKLWFTLRASASAAAPDSPILFHPRLWKKVLQN